MSFTRTLTAPTEPSHLNTGGPPFSSRSFQFTPVNGVIRLTVAPASDALARMIGLAALQPGVARLVSLPPVTRLPPAATVTVPPAIVSVRQPERKLRVTVPF